MKQLITFTLVLLCTLQSISANDKDYTFKEVSSKKVFTEFETSSSIDLEIYKVNRRSDCKVEIGISLEADFDRVEYKFEGGRAVLSLKSDISTKKIFGWTVSKGFKDNEKYLVRIYTTDIEEIDASSSSDVYVMSDFSLNSPVIVKAQGAADIVFKGDITTTEDLTVEAASSSDIEFESKASLGKDLLLSTSGSADIVFDDILKVGQSAIINASASSDIYLNSDLLSGNSLSMKVAGSSNLITNNISVEDNLSASVSSSSDMELGKISVNRGNVSLSSVGSADIEIYQLNILKGNVEMSSSSSSSIEIKKGEVSNKEIISKMTIAGSAGIEAKNFKISHLRLTASSSSDAEINVLNSLQIDDVSSSARIRYVKNPNLTFDLKDFKGDIKPIK